ncbi:MAG: SIMPL domain-containing protein [Alphaproteobacteria bacterium]|nr:SIMPL domain-containing protein [Alphaproteobacteria bacterium]MCL2890200.1 SIMPL domain-containing protein [Alphaproteobacteria bacterium]
MKILSAIKSAPKCERTDNHWNGVALILAIGIAIGGYFIGNGVYDAFARRTVTVKGLAEQNVVADTAIWNINISNVGGDLAELQSRVDADIVKIKEFLSEAGFAADEIQNNRVQVRDNFAGYSPVELRENIASARNQSRYVISTGVMVRSNNVNLVDATSRRMGELVRRGVTITEDYSGPIYIFNGLNDIKIPMIEQATRNATDAGRQFASDAGARLGRIQSANQGVFSIESRDPIDRWNNDEKQSIHKKVRVVSTVVFYLR